MPKPEFETYRNRIVQAIEWLEEKAKEEDYRAAEQFVVAQLWDQVDDLAHKLMEDDKR